MTRPRRSIAIPGKPPRTTSASIVLAASLMTWLTPIPIAHAEAPSPGGRAAPADSEADEEEDDSSQAAALRAAQATRYQGVSPGSDRLPPRMGRPAADARRGGTKGPARMTWLGFQMREGVPTVFIQLSHPVAWSVSEQADKLIYTLVGTTIPLSNNRRPLDVAEFGTALNGVEARRRGKDVELTIRLKKNAAVAHHERNQDAAGGFKFLVVELPRTS